MGKKEATGEKLVSNLGPRSPVAECYRILRTNLQFLEVERQLRSVLVTSAAPQDGKTLTSCNLAITIAQAGTQVVLVDADLRKSRVHRMFGMDNRTGLTTVLTGLIPLPEALREVDVPNLKVLTAGPKPPNPAEMLGSARMAALLAELNAFAEMVIVDSPPVMAVTDAVVLSTMVDGVVLVLKANDTTYQQAQRTKAMLEQVKARILGVVLDQVSLNGVEGYQYYYYYGEGEGRSRRRRRR
jgi:capsular exopolysaccharide synthesis family protein